MKQHHLTCAALYVHSIFPIFADMIRFTPILYISALLCLTAITQSYAQSQYYDIVDKADKAIKESNWIEAESYLVEAMRLEPANPGNILLMSNLGMVQFQNGQDSLALQTLNNAHIMAPSSVTVLQNRARVLLATNRATEAYRDYSAILSIDSTVVEPRFYHTLLAMEQGLDSICTKDLAYMNHHMPDNRLTYLANATVLRIKGKYDEAIPYLTKLLEKEKYSEHYAARAICEMMTGDLNSAATDVAEAITLDPADGELYLTRALLNKMRYRPDDAKIDGKRAIDLGVNPQKVRQLLK